MTLDERENEGPHFTSLELDECIKGTIHEYGDVFPKFIFSSQGDSSLYFLVISVGDEAIYTHP
jgi:hypothetical protein